MNFPARLICLLVVASAVVAASGQTVSDPTAKIAELQPKANAGDAEAQYELAKVYMGALTGKLIDPEKGLNWLRKSAEAGYPDAQNVLGVLYRDGYSQRGVNLAQDAQQAASWFRKAARHPTNANNTKSVENAQKNLSKMLAEGLISKEDADWSAKPPVPKRPVDTDSGKSKSGPPPFSLAEVETGLSGGITNKRMATLIGTYGVNFSLNAKTQKQLADAGADDPLLAAISSSKH